MPNAAHVSSGHDYRQTTWQTFQQIAMVLLIVAALFTTLYVAANVWLNFGTKLKGAPFLPWQTANTAILGIHIATAVPPLLLGFYTFMPESRRAGNKAHRWVGTIYCVTIWISAATGLMLASANTRGIVAQLGFGCLAVAWFSTTWMAYKTARAKDFVVHRRWMIRSFALTLAVVAVRPMFIFPPPFDIPYETWYRAITWLCWVPNLMIAEVYLRITHYSGKLALQRRARARGNDTASARRWMACRTAAPRACARQR